MFFIYNSRRNSKAFRVVISINGIFNCHWTNSLSKAIAIATVILPVVRIIFEKERLEADSNQTTTPSPKRRNL